MHLTALRVRRPRSGGSRYPFTVPAIGAMERLTFPTPITFLVGENGSGKSTLLEGLASAIGLPAVGSADLPRDHTLAPARALGAALQLTWTVRTMRGFFLRAEDFFGFTRRLSRERAELLADVARIEAEYTAAGRTGKPLSLALMPYRTSLAEMERRYGTDLDANSHGQAFLRVFTERFVPGGLYLLDEPEAALSPTSQIALLAMLRDLVDQNAQFVIATHAPILLACPGATIYSFDEAPPRAVPFDTLEHVQLTRAFLEEPERYLRHLRGNSV